MANIEGEIVKRRTIEGDVKVAIAATPDIQIGETTTLDNDTPAYVELAEGSTKLKPILNFGIPAGPQGLQGGPGVDGYTPIKGIDYFDGEPGPEGKPGADGYTPIKGVDYFDGKDGAPGETGPQGNDYVITEKDYTAIANNVIEQVSPTLESNLQEAKDYADGIKPTKTSELTNDSKFAVTDQNNNFSASQTINGTLTVNGSIVQNGENYETHAEQVFTKDDEIITRDGAVGGLSEGSYAGIIAKKYDGTNDGRLGFNAAGEAKVGDVGDEQPLLTRDEVVNLQEGQVLIWDGTKLRAVGSSDFVKNTDYVTSTTPGIVKIGSGLGIWLNANKELYVVKATDTEIDAKTSNYKVIVPSNLEYAVKSVGDGHYVKNTDYATGMNAGIVMSSGVYGTLINTDNGVLKLSGATETDIDAETNIYKPITSATYRYAVNKIINDRFKTLTQDEYDKLETKSENTYYDIVED